MRDPLQSCLEESNLGQFYAALASKGITMQSLVQLNLQDFSNYGVVSMADRRKLYGVITKLRKGDAGPSPVNTKPAAQAPIIDANNISFTRSRSAPQAPTMQQHNTPTQRAGTSVSKPVSRLQLHQQQLQAKLYKGTHLDPARKDSSSEDSGSRVPKFGNVSRKQASAPVGTGPRTQVSTFKAKVDATYDQDSSLSSPDATVTHPPQRAHYNYGVPTAGATNTYSRELPNSSGRIRVCVRKRPLSRKEYAAADKDVARALGRHNLQILEDKVALDTSKFVQEHNFVFDEVFDEHCTNEQVYQCTGKLLVDHVFQGGKATVFAYGQTGSGKTFTMMGTNEVEGLIMLAAEDIFDTAASPLHAHLTVDVGFFEIYCGNLHDLLNQRKQLNAREDGKGQVVVAGLREIRATCPEDLHSAIAEGMAARKTGSTGANEDSSRSHAILQIQLKDNKGRQKGRFSFIDLAGSERAADNSDYDKTTKLEGAEINQSLLALKECIRALDKSQRHTPFRQSKLTQVLRDSLVGNSRTCMIANISPNSASTEHTLNTLRYADRVKELKNDGDSKAAPSQPNPQATRRPPASPKPPTRHPTATATTTTAPGSARKLTRPLSTGCLNRMESPSTPTLSRHAPAHNRTPKGLSRAKSTDGSRRVDIPQSPALSFRAAPDMRHERFSMDVLEAPTMGLTQGLLDTTLADWNTGDLLASPTILDQPAAPSENNWVEDTPRRYATRGRSKSSAATPYHPPSASGPSLETPSRPKTPKRGRGLERPEVMLGRRMAELLHASDSEWGQTSDAIKDLAGGLERRDIALSVFVDRMEQLQAQRIEAVRSFVDQYAALLDSHTT